MVSVRNLSKSFDGKPVLQNLSFDFPERAVCEIAGPSGAGKTTLVNLILGLLTPDGGEVLKPDNIRQAAVFQEDRLIEHFGAFENVRLTADKSVSAEDIRKALEMVGLPAGEKQRVSKYSGGMKRRVAIVRAVLARPELLILDEPFKGLDEEIRAVCADFIRKNCPQATILLITHDSGEADLMCAQKTLSLK